MHLESYEVFCAAVDYGSLHKAAQGLHMTQSTASRHIQALENEYGGELFARSATGLTLTPLGEALFPYAVELLNCHQQSKEKLNRLRREGSGLAVGATLTVGEYVLPQMLGQLRKNYPEAQIRMRVCNTQQVLDDLIHHRIDIGIVEAEVPQELEKREIHSMAWREDHLVLVCSPNHPLTCRDEVSITDLSGESLLWREEGSGTRRVAEEALEKAEIFASLSVAMELGSTQAIKSAIIANLGIAFLSELTVMEERREGVLAVVPITNFSIVRTLFIVQRVERYAKFMVERLLEGLQVSNL